ncbi:MFS general substrate transporter [Morchella conica CCBAS932]|uniref:MFS general substrate transporter n=1 Tax=Morchella conica CCBAS932 TaxID=1392247 RepID=A0A3N4KW79_9PEZI|nr:MFS general substrate transporter [Morchella conica CCBAS932]
MQRRASSLHYQTFPTTPPATSGPPPVDGFSSPLSNTYSQNADNNSSKTGDTGAKSDNSTPIPIKQLTILAVISLAEQTALNSFSPYLPEMTSSFPDVDKRKVGLFVGIIASSFAAAQFGTNFFWGRLSDKIGRKPVILAGTLLTALCFLAFGFCRTLFQAVAVQAVMGLVNGNAGIVSTVLGEITDKSNQSAAFSYLPVVYGIGGITGPLIGGILVHSSRTGVFSEYPYLLPNIVAAVLLLLDLLVSIFLLDESLKEAQSLPPLGKRVKNLFVWLWQFTAGAKPGYLHTSSNNRDSSSRGEEHEDYFGDEIATSALFPEISTPPSYRSIITPEIAVLLITYSIFNLSNISYNSLYPIFVSSEPPTGRGLFPKEIGLSLAFVGTISIVFQLLLFGPMQERLGNHWGYRLGLFGFTIAFWAMPFVGYYDDHDPSSKFWLWAELGGVLFLKTLSTVIGLTCAMLLITNGSPNASTLGTLNGLAQTLSAGGRAIGPLVSGGLFTAATTVPKGEFLAWGVFGGIAGVGLILSMISVKGRALETIDEEEGENEDEEGDNESSGLLRDRSGHREL